MELLALLGEAVAVPKEPWGQRDIEEGWTDDLRREFQEEISISRSVLRRHGPAMVRYLRPRLDEWMEQEAVRPGRLRHLVLNVRRQLVDARGKARWGCTDLRVQGLRPVRAQSTTLDTQPLRVARGCTCAKTPSSAKALMAGL